ncbi:glucans biosynthesis glucosyltransferase MdoH [Roseibacillus persicicus]|uniref:glucans biosynthesis glucosyltransferase MdoH n=1 Tax=Roseibacillus persicicus TaxID=454148 RepID=UPI00366FF019
MPADPMKPVVLFLASVLGLALLGWALFTRVILADGWQWGDLLLFASFALLFGYLCFGFCHAAFGFFSRRRPAVRKPDSEGEHDGEGRVAIVMPVYNEPVERVMQGLEATFNSVLEEADGTYFDLFILSDSTKVRKWVEEKEAWLRWLQRSGLDTRIFYRHRNHNTGRKAGNVADFCNEYGDRYDFMVVLDADSVMTGETLVELRRRMNANPRLGLLQTVPRLVGASSFYGRLQQFSNRVYGGLFLSGLSYWQGEGGNFWGHNAIIRMKAFKECCGLPLLPGPGGLGGEILSHDFVEAGLLRAKGWEVRLAEDLAGSYEEGPQSLIEAARRDRRWCEGNLQHSTFLLSKGLRQRTRIHLANGILGYLSSPLWLVLIVLSLLVLGNRGEGPPGGDGVALLLLLYTVALLLVPKLLCFVDLALDREEVAKYGGRSRVFAGGILETFSSILLAPINMVFHTQFVIAALLGCKVRWDAQNRDAEGTSWEEAWTVHRAHLFVGLGLQLLAVFTSGWTGFLFTLPVTLPLVFSPFLSVCTSRPSQTRLLATPEELSPPPEVASALRPAKSSPLDDSYWIRRMLIEPPLHIAHLAGTPPTGRQERDAKLIEKVYRNGPSVLSEEEKTYLLQSRDCLEEIHLAIWQTPKRELPKVWRRRGDFPAAA